MFKNELIRIITEEIENYHGEHTAPSPQNDDLPMYDVEDMFPDIYTQGDKLYGYGDRNNMEAIRLIQQAKGRRDMSVKIYRAVPDVNSEINRELKKYYDPIKNYNKFNSFPVGNEIIGQIKVKYNSNSEYVGEKYDELQKIVYDELWDNINKLEAKKQKIKINNGDWVTIVKDYAVEHGRSNLNNKYKILTKTVRARDLYTEGNDVSEWGYYR